MDPAASVTGLIGLAGELIPPLYRFCGDLKSYGKERKQMAEDIERLYKLLCALRLLVGRYEGRIPLTQLQLPAGDGISSAQLQECEKTLKEVKALVMPQSSGKSSASKSAKRSFITPIKWAAFNKDEVEKLITRLGRQVQTFQLTLENVSMYSL
jgi:hypothetical protein